MQTRVYGSVHTRSGKSENTALFLRWGLPSTLIRHENGFSKTLFKPEEFKNASLRFSVDRKRFENGAFRKRWRHE